MSEGKAERINRKLISYDFLVGALKNILADHDERFALYGKREGQPNRVAVMEEGREALRAAGEEA